MTLAPRRFGLRIRLIALVLIPALVAAALVGSIATDRAEAADDAAAVEVTVDALTSIIEFRAALMLARVPVEVEVRSQALGIDSELALDLLDLDAQQLGDLSEATAALEQIPASVRPFPSSRLQDLEADIAAGADLAVIDSFAQLEQATDDAGAAQLRRLDQQTIALGHPTLGAEVADLEAAADAAIATGSLVTGLADYWFATIGDVRRVEPARVQLGISQDQFEASVAAMLDSADPKVADAAAQLDEAWSDGPFHTAISDAVTGRPAAPFADGLDLGLIITTFTDSFDLFAPSFDVVTVQSQGLSASARALSQDASRTAALTVALAVAIVVAMLALSIWVAASFGRPLRRLIAGMRSVGHGDLTTEPLDPSGPNEVAAASAAFNDVVANLRLLEAKVNALANADLDDPHLQEPLPGALGDALSRSVEVLSSSIVERTDLQVRLAHQASHDALTDIANRAGALEALNGALARAKRHRTALAVAFLDLDRFKQANDTYGHQTGDLVLQEVARRLVDEARSGDFCARLGGDEFIVIAEQVDGPDGALALARRIAEAIEQPISAGPHQIRIGASVGVALAAPGDDPLGLLAKADQASYRAKRSRSVVDLYDPSLAEAARRRAEMESPELDLSDEAEPVDLRR